MMKVLVDSDVMFDFISARLPFYYEAERLFTLAERKRINVVTIPHLVINVWQIRGHMKISSHAMYKSLSQMLTFIQILNEPAKAITNAIMIKNTDFEDQVTIECAVFHNVDVIVSRNSKHFKKSPLNVYRPGEFMDKTFPEF